MNKHFMIDKAFFTNLKLILKILKLKKFFFDENATQSNA